MKRVKVPLEKKVLPETMYVFKYRSNILGKLSCFYTDKKKIHMLI